MPRQLALPISGRFPRPDSLASRTWDGGPTSARLTTATRSVRETQAHLSRCLSCLSSRVAFCRCERTSGSGRKPLGRPIAVPVDSRSRASCWDGFIFIVAIPNNLFRLVSYVYSSHILQVSHLNSIFCGKSWGGGTLGPI